MSDKNDTLRTVLRSTSLGQVRITASAHGIASIVFGDAFEPAGDAEDQQLRKWADAFVVFLEQPALGFDAPLTPQGTAFQQRVWAALRALPLGTTTTYAALAERMGLSPTAARAVATACAANPIAVAIPCHRVLRGDGGLGGYSGGLERKRTLLAREGAILA